MASDVCAFKKCNKPIELIYLGKPICDFHWVRFAHKVELLRKNLGLPKLKEEIKENGNTGKKRKD